MRRECPRRLPTLGPAFALALGLLVSAEGLADDWPQWLGPQRDSVWRESGIVRKFPEGGPPVVWRAPLGAGYAGPAVAGGRVYVTDRVLDTGARNPDNPFARGQIAGSERVHCLDAFDGEVVWSHEYDCPYTVSYPSGPRATPLVADGKVYTLGTEGNLICFDAADGTVHWSRELKKDYNVEAPLWGFSASPLLDENRLICLVGGEGSTVVAFDKDTGDELWKSLSAREPGYCPPVIFDVGDRRQLIVWHPEAINGLDPASGEVLWSVPFEVRSALTITTPRLAGNRLFVTAFYNGPMMLELDGTQGTARVAWKGTRNSERKTDKLHAIMCTPFIEDGYIYGVCSYGQLRCLTVETGERIWEDLKATGSTGNFRSRDDRWANAFLIKNGDRFFLPNEHGDLIIAKLSPAGYEEVSRAHLLEPTDPSPGRDVVWSHPAFANRRVYMRNDKEIISVDLAQRGEE
ncbi:MAG: pyrrolo-quinoline quinone [Planctomycetota bacterium]|nr:MAG: pyrrolo-quinoline quinone [Planctomycetota bacterium]REJ90021.1 MAG: pyrrolo-quinoline quinone [Planctomycetota bacterium]REK22406.1 MAG: pyrrolo-quinoline quinone [Planctomycetota bacterium]REK39734.1 MAG: pyrrolo-quinoline quinone [Planctomycetota bacterium]